MSNTPDTRREGEAVIRRALIRSLAGFALAGGILFLVFRWTGMETAPPEKIDEAVPRGAVEEQPAAVSPPAVSFTDITASAGIDFVHVSGAYGERLMPETMGGGGGFIDYDNDGDADIVLINSRYWEGREQQPAASSALYRNDGDGRFTDVSAETGMDLHLYGMGFTAADFDNDGWVDIYVTALGGNRLLRNERGRFVDVTEAAGVAGFDDDWATAAAFFDYDNDGDVDLFVAHYVKWSRKVDLEIDFRATGIGRAYGAPDHFVGTDNRLYRNEGDGRFTDVSLAAGMHLRDTDGRPLGKALGVAVIDYDRDGWLDMVVANDTSRNLLFRNKGDGTFEETGAFEGLAFDRDGKATGAMGIDSAFYRNDAELGIAIGNFANEMSSLFVTMDGRLPFADEAILEGVGPDTRLALTFGVMFFDYDLDGWTDYFQVNGHIEPEINRVQPSQQYAQPAQLFWQCPQGCRSRFVRVGLEGELGRPMVGRAAAWADIDNDGDLDMLVVQNGRAAKLFRNDQQTGHHWLRLKLEGGADNRDAIGALVELTAGGVTRRQRLMPSRGYLAQMEMPLTFGLGELDRVEDLVVHWPNGTRQAVPVDGIDTILHVKQAAP